MEVKIQHSRQVVLGCGIVVTEPTRCVQCGICAFNCPAGIDIRRIAWKGGPVGDGRCLTCGQCIARCPRGVLRFEKL